MANYSYCLLRGDGTSRTPNYSFESIWDEESPEELAEAAAADYWSNRDGWEATWPISFAIFGADSSLIGNFDVELEYDPWFSAKAVKEAQ